MIPKNKRHLIVNKEYSRLPYWTDEGYEDVQRQVSQKYVQDSFGKFAESENQPPYLNDSEYDDGYQGLEYQYQNPEFFDSTKLPDIDFKNTIPKGNCYELWVSLFGKGTGVFIPNSQQWSLLGQYAAKCPLIYMPHICCKNMTISGPSSLTPGQEANYTVSGGDAGCAYDMKATGGEFVGNKYFAPSTPGTYELYVTPWMSDDQGKKCASMSITIEGGCHGVIGYTTLQMATSGTQTLTVTGGGVGDTYTWTTTSGSINPTTGTSVTFTAPASNANCTSNPTISLTCGGAVVDTLQIAINAYTDFGVGLYGTKTAAGTCFWPGPGYKYEWWSMSGKVESLSCAGAVTLSGTKTVSVGGASSCGEAESWANAQVLASLTISAWGVWEDRRSPAALLGGCCPAQLM